MIVTPTMKFLLILLLATKCHVSVDAFTIMKTSLSLLVKPVHQSDAPILFLRSSYESQDILIHRATKRGRRESTLRVLPNDNQFYDGYEDFIRDLQEDLDNDIYDIYENDNVIQESVTSPLATKVSSVASSSPSSYKRGGKKTSKNRRRKNKSNIIKYKRDPNDDMSQQVKTEEVEALIKERTKAQKIRDYTKADEILHNLNNEYNVYVWDKDRLWSASAIAPSRRYNSNSGQGRTFGRNGHDYKQIGNGINDEVCTLSLDKIHSLLAKRLEHKLVKQYRKADEVQRHLYENGVRVHDKLKQWRADGGIFEDIESKFSAKEYTMNKYSELIEDSNIIKEVETIVNEWVSIRNKMDYKNADRIRQELWDKHRVAVDDKSKTWSHGGDFGPNGTFRWTDNGPINPRRNQERAKRDWRKVGMYSKSEYSEAIENPDDEEEVWNLIHDRLEARRVKDYDVADLIKDHLYQEYQVSVDDQLRQWSVGGEFEETSKQSIRLKSPTSADGKVKSTYLRAYNRRGGQGNLSKKHVALVEAMIKRRSEEMARYNQQAADSIRNGLKRKYHVVIDDMNGEWHARGNNYTVSPQLEDSMPPHIKLARKEIEMLIRERSQAKGEKDYSRADEIRSDLLDIYGVRLDDRLKEWSILKHDPSITSHGSVQSATKEEDSTVNNHVQEGWGMNVQLNIDEVDDFDCKNEAQTFPDEEKTLESLTVTKLREELKSAGLPINGRKADLIQRLIEHG